jgi:hypothetical protein
MAHPGPRGRQHDWQTIAAPPGEPTEEKGKEITFFSCPCGAQRKATPGALRRGPACAYRPKGTGRWQERAPACGRPIEIPVKRSATAAGAPR